MRAALWRTIGPRTRAGSLLLAATLVAVTGQAGAEDPDTVRDTGDAGLRWGRRPGVYIDVPAPDRILEPQDVYFYGKKRLEVPGSVAVNVPPYVCDVDGSTFTDKTEFITHLRINHAELLHEIPDPFIVHEGQVHFIGK